MAYSCTCPFLFLNLFFLRFQSAIFRLIDWGTYGLLHLHRINQDLSIQSYTCTDKGKKNYDRNQKSSFIPLIYVNQLSEFLSPTVWFEYTILRSRTNMKFGVARDWIETLLRVCPARTTQSVNLNRSHWRAPGVFSISDASWWTIFWLH